MLIYQGYVYTYTPFNLLQWQRETCTNAELHKLMKMHDSYYQAYKKYSAMNKSSEFVAGYKLLSFAGFLR